MPVPKWFIIAKNEYRIKTSKIRSLRPFFPYLVVGLLAIYVLFLAPAIVSYFTDEFLAFILSQVAMASIQIILFMIFFYFIILPITYTLREEQTRQVEIFLSAPIRPSDVLLGEFLGVMPFYAIAITVIAGLFTALLLPLGLDFVQMGIIVFVIVLVFFSALWIGSVIAAILRTKFGKTARGKDIGRALAMIIALPLLAIFYAITTGGLFQALADPGTGGMIKTILGVLPSSWGAELIVAFAANPGNMGVIATETITRLGGLIVFFLVTLWLGTQVANRAYSLETTSFTAATAKPDGLFYKTVNSLGGGGSFGSLVVSVYKDYGRRLENLSKIIYMMGLLALMSIFFFESTDPEGIIVLTQFILPLLSAFVIGEVTLRGKETLFIYKKAPSGIRCLVKARLLQGLLVVVPIALITSFLTAIMYLHTLEAALIHILLGVSIVASSSIFVLGLFLLNPAFSAKSGNYFMNIMITMQILPIAFFLAPLIILGRFLELGLYEIIFFVTIPMNWLIALFFLYLGYKRLKRIE